MRVTALLAMVQAILVSLLLSYFFFCFLILGIRGTDKIIDGVKKFKNYTVFCFFFCSCVSDFYIDFIVERYYVTMKTIFFLWFL